MILRHQKLQKQARELKKNTFFLGFACGAMTAFVICVLTIAIAV